MTIGRQTIVRDVPEDNTVYIFEASVGLHDVYTYNYLTRAWGKQTFTDDVRSVSISAVAPQRYYDKSHDWKFIFGDSTSNAFYLNDSATQDDDANIATSWESKDFLLPDGFTEGTFHKAWFELKSSGSKVVTLDWSTDGGVNYSGNPQSHTLTTNWKLYKLQPQGTVARNARTIRFKVYHASSDWKMRHFAFEYSPKTVR